MTENQRVLMLIDGGNISKSVWALKDATTMVDYVKLVPDLLRGRQLARWVYYREGNSISDKFIKLARNHFFGEVVTTGNSSDIPLTIEAMMQVMMGNFDTLILLSGDGDFLPLVHTMKRLGKRVEVASLQHATGRPMRHDPDSWYEIEDTYFFKPGNTEENG
jgi:uncharacterized protein (TIGR00288 family)